MNTNQPIQKKKISTIQLATHIAADGYVELLADVAGAYTIRDQLKAAGFRFVRDDQPSNENTGGKTSSAWRRILVAVPPEVTQERAVKGIDMAISDFEKLLEGVLAGARIRGAKAAALALSRHWPSCEDLTPVVEKLASLDSPWENIVKRPEFAA